MKLNYLGLILSITIISSIFISCSKDVKLLPALIQADTIMQSNPNRAYKILLSIKDTKLQNAEEKALFALLLTQAEEKNMIPHKNDTLISFAVNYYKNTTKKKMKDKAYFYYGRVLQEKDSISAAICSYLKALNEKSEDYKTQTLIYENLAACYENQNFFRQALEAYQKSYLINKMHKDSIGELYSLRGIANLYVLQEDTSKAISYYNQALSIIEQTNDTSLKSAVYCDISRFFHNQMDYESANKYINKAIQNASSQESMLTTLYWKGKIFYDQNLYDSAYYYLSQASQSIDIYTKAACYQSLYELSKDQKLYFEAIRYNDQALCLYDSIQNSMHQEEINDILKEHSLSLATQKYKSIHQKHITIISFCSLTTLFALIIFFMWFSNRNKKKRLVLQQELMRTIADRNELKEQSKHLALTNENAMTENKILQTNLMQLWKQTMIISRELFYTTESFKKIISIEKCNYIPNKQRGKEEIEIIRNDIKNSFGQAIQNLQETFPALNQDDLVYCILSYLKLSISTIKICMLTTSNGALTQRKYRVRKQMTLEVFNFIFSVADNK